MDTYNYQTHSRTILGDLHTPVSTYLKVRYDSSERDPTKRVLLIARSYPLCTPKYIGRKENPVMPLSLPHRRSQESCDVSASW